MSVGLEGSEFGGGFESIEQTVSVLEVDEVVFDSRVEGAREAVFAQVLARQDAEGLVEGVALVRPQGAQVRDGVDASLVRVVDLHEVLVAELQEVEHAQSAFAVFVDVAEDGLGVVLDHIFGFGLFLLEAFLLEVAAFGTVGGFAVGVAVELDFVLHFLEGGHGVALLYDFDWTFA